MLDDVEHNLLSVGAIIGVGASEGLGAIHWGVARGILVAWVLTIPAAAAMAALAFLVLRPILGA